MIRSLFEKHLKFLKVKVYWRDGDMDYVRIKSDEELNIAVVEMKTEIINIFVVAHHGGLHLVDLIIRELKSHMIC
jgi:hypothetical protein